MNKTVFLSLAVAAGQLLHADDKVDFAKSVKPIFESRCLDCHGPKKQKADLRLDSKEAAMKGGEDGKVIIAGKPDESPLFKRISLPAGHDDIMPPKGDPLTKEQIATLKSWIEQGANWPDGLMLSLEKPAESGGIFVSSIKPIFESRCLDCHGPKKQKADLRLDSKEAAMKGGEDGKVIIAGKPDESPLFKRVSLPAGHDDIMPPKGDPLTKEQIAALKDWIAQGAPWPDGLTLGGEAGNAAVMKKKKAQDFANLTPTKDTAAEQEAITKLGALGISVRPIAQNLQWKEATVRPQDTNKVSEAVALLKDIPSLVDLNLANLRLSDEDLKNIADLTNLQRLHLENNPITDAGLEHVKKLANLEYLNLYNTAVGDEGMKQLQGLTNLQALYLWQSKVTEEGAANLKKSLPEAYINRGEDLKLLAKATDEKEEKKDEKK